MNRVYAKGSAVARVAVGGLAKREKYEVTLIPVSNGVQVRLHSEMSGWGGGIPGKMREKSGRENMKTALSHLVRQFQ